MKRLLVYLWRGQETYYREWIETYPIVLSTHDEEMDNGKLRMNFKDLYTLGVF